MRVSGEIGRERQERIETEILGMMKQLRKAGEGFELLIAEGEEQVWAAVLQNIMQVHPDFSVVMWPSGPGIVRRRDIDAINPDFKKINEATGFLITGGESFNVDDINPQPRSMASGGVMGKNELEKEIPNAYELYDNHPALKKE